MATFLVRMPHRIEPISGDLPQIDRAILEPVELVELAVDGQVGYEMEDIVVLL